MSVQEIKAAVAQLPAGELDELLEQLEEMRQELWGSANRERLCRWTFR